MLANCIDWKKGVYVLIDYVSFSAAMSNAAQYKQLLNATLVGSPTGAKPLGYQDVGQFQLLNSEVEATYSKRIYHFIEGDTESINPSVYVDFSLRDYQEGRDFALLKCL